MWVARGLRGHLAASQSPHSRALALAIVGPFTHYRSCVSGSAADNGDMHPHVALDTLRSENRRRAWRALNVLAPVVLITMTIPFAAAQEPTAAVLKLHEVDFFYRSAIAPFSCGGLERRVKSVLHALGARDDIAVRVSNCNLGLDPQTTINTGQSSSDPFRTSSDTWGSSSDRWEGSSDRLRNRRLVREQSSHIRVRLMMPVEVTPEILEEMKRDKSRRELVSRVTDNPNAALDDPIVFPAQRQTITLSRRTIDLEPEE